VEGAEVLPDGVGNAAVMEEEEEFFAENAGEGEGDVAEEHVGGPAVVLVAV
jgi:hypothetical protein